MRKVWFVFQGSTFTEDKGMKYLWAPELGTDNRSRFYWQNVFKVKEGDVVFNYSEGAVRGVSLAKSNGYNSENADQDSPWGKNGYRVDIDFFPFQPIIRIEELTSRKNQFDMYLATVTNKPFDSNGKPNQGYLYEFTEESGRLIKEIYGKEFGNKIIDDFFNNVGVNPMNPNLTPKGLITYVHQFITGKGFQYQFEEIANFYLSLKTKPFVILAGISGTGKTQLPRKFAYAIGMSQKQLIQVPVRPDWTDSSDLLGYIGLDQEFKPKELTLAIIEAQRNPEKPYFFILDEMNLARVEHYFSDFLSIIETRERKGESIETDPILRVEILKNAKNGSEFTIYGWPENLYLIGTVNMDETTHAFSRKVLDRANSIEMNEVNLTWQNMSLNDIIPLHDIDNSFFKTKFIISSELSSDEKNSIITEMDLLIEINRILEKADLHFAYRVRDEVAFYLILNKKYELIDNTSAMDFQIVQKILPRIHGSSERVQVVLIELLNLLEGKSFRTNGFDCSLVDGHLDFNNLKFRRSSKKIFFMLKRYDDERFTSFWI